jgi:hypothetical protein
MSTAHVPNRVGRSDKQLLGSPHSDDLPRISVGLSLTLFTGETDQCGTTDV